jgi:uncharacterized membrane protein YdjX (TVP38/TMEM64 family)
VHDQPDHLKPLKRRLLVLALMVAALVCLAIAWTSTPLREWLNVDRIVGTLQQFGQAFGPVAAIGGFGLAVSLAVPLTFLSLVTFVAFGPWAGFVYCMSGALLGAAVSHGIGAFLGREAVQRLGGPRVKGLSQRLADHGLLAVIAVRVVPVAPFAIVNMVAGASHISLKQMLLGTLLGMTPGMLIMMFFIDQIIAALKNPGPLTFAILAGTVVLIAVGLWGLRRWLRYAEARQQPAATGSTESG